MSFAVVGRCLAVIAVLLLAPAAIAQQSGQQTPAQVLGGYPNGGPDMAAQVQALLNADRANLSAIIAFAKTATEDQRKAIAQGLAQVAKSYAANDPAFVTQIQQQVAAAGLPEFAKAYADAAGDAGTASTGGGGGGGGGPTAAGPPNGGSNTGTIFPGSTFTTTQASSLTTTSGIGGLGNNSVSP